MNFFKLSKLLDYIIIIIVYIAVLIFLIRVFKSIIWLTPLKYYGRMDYGTF